MKLMGIGDEAAKRRNFVEYGRRVEKMVAELTAGQQHSPRNAMPRVSGR
ncbi:MAG: hypothetical protein ABSE16_03030 [Verrucomicrobiota bacterium]|jgi:hypothetical protein